MASSGSDPCATLTTYRTCISLVRGSSNDNDNKTGDFFINKRPIIVIIN
jgi:hypothetical protein